MNICFFIGRVCSNINFKFILNSKDISIAIFNIQLLNGSIIKVKGYNEIADYCYTNLEENMIVSIEGYIDNKSEIIIENINDECTNIEEELV